MTRHPQHRIAAVSAAGAALALGAGILVAGPAQAEDAASTTSTAQTTAAAASQDTASQSPESFANLALVRSAAEPTVYWLKAPAPNGIGEVPAPDGTYSVDLTSGSQHEHFVVDSHEGRLDLKDSHILKTAPFDPQITVQWVG